MMVGGWVGHWHVVESGYGGTRTKVSRVFQMASQGHGAETHGIPMSDIALVVYFQPPCKSFIDEAQG